MSISLLGFFFGLLLLAVPTYTIYRFKLPFLHRLARVFGRMCIAVAVIALVVFGALRLESIVYDLAAFLLFAVLSSVLAIGKARLNASRLLLPVGVGSIVAVALVGFYFIFLVCGEKSPFLPHVFVPMLGIIAGGIVEANGKALQAYYSGLLNHGQLYNYLLGNGGTHHEATMYLLRRCLLASITSVARRMSRVVFATAPLLLLAMVMSGSDVLTAAAFQVLFYVAVMAASLISLFIALWLGRRYSFDEYERLKSVKKEGITVSLQEESASDSSSSLSEPRHTDSESQPQEA